MAGYSVEISRTAEKQLRKLTAADREKVARALVGLGTDPHPPGSRKLSGYNDVFRIRVGVYRVLYSVEGRRLIVIILKIGHRRDVYR
ncbi:MAG: type II toxin-antitoxin system RelE/ParE family toxin [Gammaproteobacteria bacterium]|nr:type II toxin-antitoxin system RelE/ParE family toxin [Gammaproteobacteria bacterium]